MALPETKPIIVKCLTVANEKAKKRKLLQGELVGGFNAIAVLEESARDQ
jgi:hypothetical protein